MPEFFFHVRLDIPRWGTSSSTTISVAPLQTDLFATPPTLAHTPPTAPKHQASQEQAQEPSREDWRSGVITIESIDMMPVQSTAAAVEEPSAPSSTSAPVTNPLSKRIANRPGNAATKARFEPSELHETQAGWGVVRIYRDLEETPGLYGHDAPQPSLNPPATFAQTVSKSDKNAAAVGSENNPPLKDEECCTLGILAVPSYMSPADFLGWVGNKTRDEVSHFRLIRTERANRYMVLMRFRSANLAREWRKAHNGASFDATAPETAQVVFVKTIDFMDEDGASFPDVDDPFKEQKENGNADKNNGQVKKIHPPTANKEASMINKPLAPPTPNLVEMPTCPVCLERMDDSTGLLTIQCQHVFHCSCLEKWRGRGCPVCRFTHDGLASRRVAFAENPDSGPNECNICQAETNLWICLICGNVGCGRYDAAHAFLHWQQTHHDYSMQMTTQRIWSYEADAYVHRIVQNQLDGKLAQKDDTEDKNEGDHPSARRPEAELIPKEKSDAVAREYSALLSSQLESQRTYYEGRFSQAADKASQASLAATQAAEAASHALDQLSRLQEDHRKLVEETIPPLEREKDRAIKRADKASEMARKFERAWREEKTMNEGLMERVTKLEQNIAQRDAVWASMNQEMQTLREENHDMQAYISGQAALAAMGPEAAESTIIVPEEQAQSTQSAPPIPANSPFESAKKGRQRPNRKQRQRMAAEKASSAGGSANGNSAMQDSHGQDANAESGPSG